MACLSVYEEHRQILRNMRYVLCDSLTNLQNTDPGASKERMGHIKIVTELLLKILPMEQKIEQFLKKEDIPMPFPFILEEDEMILNNYIKRIQR